MASTIVFACKSNSCRSQMAEGWAKNWMKNERSKLEARRSADNNQEEEEIQRDRRLQSFLDGLVVASVALDESSVTSPRHADTILSSSPRSSRTSFFTKNNWVENINSASCVTCDGETCTSPLRRKKVKSKAIEAMAVDGLDISDATPKTIHDVLSSVTCGGGGGGEEPTRCKKQSFSLLDMLRSVSLQMSLSYAGVADVEDAPASEDVGSANTLDEQRSVDSLVVLCSCADSLKRKLSDMSKETLEWDIDAPTASAKEGEGDMAYLRVSRQIRVKVETFMNRLKESVMDGKLKCCGGGTGGKLECCDKNKKSCNTKIQGQKSKAERSVISAPT